MIRGDEFPPRMSFPKIPEDKAVTFYEKSRSYVFPNCAEGGELVTLTLTDVTELIVRDSGAHRLKCSEGLVYVKPVWVAIIIDADKWTI